MKHRRYIVIYLELRMGKSLSIGMPSKQFLQGTVGKIMMENFNVKI